MATSIDGAVHALLTMMDPTQGGVLPAGALVTFGKYLPAYEASITFQVTGVRVNEDNIAELGPSYRHEEDFDIEAILAIWAGDNDQLQRFDDVFTNYNLIETTIANNPTLNGNVRVAVVSKGDYTPDQDAAGNTVGELSININCTQRVASLT